jgi:NitT/TauT family transport system permease protein/taurine transport system permease protein
MASVAHADPRRGPLAGAFVRAAAASPVVRTLGPFVPIVVLWFAAARLELMPTAFFVGPDVVVAKIGELIRNGVLPSYLGDSAVRLLSGVGFGMAIGLPLGFLIGLNRWARKLCSPLMTFFQAVGDIAWLPLLIVWFGFTLTSMTLVIVYTVVFPLVLNVVAGVDSVPRDLLRAARSQGANRRQILLEVVVPGALPSVATGVRTGLGYGWRALIAAEIIIGASGLGFMMFDARRAGEVTEVFVGMIVLGILWYATDALVLAPIERATVERWGMVRTAGAPR